MLIREPEGNRSDARPPARGVTFAVSSGSCPCLGPRAARGAARSGCPERSAGRGSGHLPRRRGVRIGAVPFDPVLGERAAHGGLQALTRRIRIGQHFVQPTVFAGVDNTMTIAQEEIFGPVLCILSYDDEQEAVRIANDTRYGLAAYIATPDRDRAACMARRLRAGQVRMQQAAFDSLAPFGGYKMSGNGRELGPMGFEEYLETKALIGFGN